MFTGRYQTVPGEGELTQPSVTQSMAANFKADYMTPFILMPGMEQDKREELYNRIGALRQEYERGDQTGWGQWSGDALAGLAGSVLNPLSLLTGEVGGAIAGQVVGRGAGLIGRYLPSQGTALLSRSMTDIMGESAPGFIADETVGSLSQKAVSGYAMGTGFALPSEVANTYDPKTDSFNWWGGIKSSFADGGYGMLLMSAPYLGGILWGKLFRGAADHTKMPLPGEAAPAELTPQHIDDAVSKNWLTPDEGQWFKDYFFKGDTNANLAQRATDMLIKDGHPVDGNTNQVLFNILKPEDVNNFQTAVADRMANDMPENMKNLYQDFISKNSMDNLRQQPASVVDGLRGVVNFTRKRLEKAPEEMVSFHKIMRRLLPESLKEENPFTQNKIFKAMRKNQRTGVTVPSQVERRLKQESKIDRLKQQNRDYQKQLQATGKIRYQKYIDRNNERINELTGKTQPLLSHVDEVKHLRETLMPEGKTALNWKGSREYNRLLDLTRVRNDARKLMHELHLTHEYEMHADYATMLDTIAKVMKSEFGKLADNESINNYMNARIQRRIPEFKNLEIKDVQREVKEARQKVDIADKDLKSPEKREEILKAYDEEIRQSRASEVKDEYSEVKNQMDEFRENESVFSSLIKCVLGSMNG